MAADLESAWDELVEDLRHATFDKRAAEQLMRVDANCVLRVQGHDHLECSLQFDEKPPEVDTRAPHGSPEIVVEIPPEHVTRFWERSLSLAIMRDGATYEGPVRRLLSVYPILRVKAAERREGVRTDTEVGAA
jgi:hypothetical protein